ncbi:citrate lyase subunit beta/citryl-CoA lyase [Microbacterium proteolyticum]|nr:citrate lyase subunit beta/citryl-CoA lyase [Microbacterium sp. SORGH_AS_0344]MDQ1168562.1 citrate lyase subunit beta/citryl-CoA lyase [Microbacterium proteolyticum]
MTLPATQTASRGATNARRPIPADISRSWLLVNATHTDQYDAAQSSRADQIILDIEDAVDPAAKPAARNDVIDWLSTEGNGAWVRINDRASDFWSDDVDALKDLPGLAGVVLAKTESGAQVTETFDRLGSRTPIVALDESAVGVEDAVSIATAQGCFRLAFGSGDYRRDTGTSADHLPMAYPRSRLVIASRVGRLWHTGPSASQLPGLRSHSARSLSAKGACVRAGARD